MIRSDHIRSLILIFLYNTLTLPRVTCRDCIPYDKVASQVANQLANCLEDQVDELVQRNLRKSILIQEIENKINSLQRMFRNFQARDVVGRRLFTERSRGQRAFNDQKDKDGLGAIERTDDMIASYGGFGDTSGAGTGPAAASGVSNNNANANTNDVKQALETSNINYNAVAPSSTSGVTFTKEQFRDLLRALSGKNNDKNYDKNPSYFT